LLQAKRGAGIPVQIVDSERLEQLCRSSEHQGLVARMGDYPYRSIEQFEQELADKSAMAVGATGAASNGTELTPLIVICDRIQDTFNFGAILRCCDGASVLAVVVGDRAQALVTPHVARSSAGAVNHIAVVQSPDLIATARRLQSLGWQLVAADCNATQRVWESPLKGSTALIIGSEAHGICPELLEICDQRVRIPMHGQVTSLNAAVAAGILLYEIRRQQLSAAAV
jgi:23S rRNA (guanosine2251-2'-O)-methyltransferase